MKSRITRGLVATLGLALATFGLSLTTAAPAHAGDPAAQTARWLAKQLTDGLAYNEQYMFNDYGLSIDIGMALNDLGFTGSAKQVRKALAANITSYVTDQDFGGNSIYAGAVAKSAAYAQETKADPRDFGGLDLIKLLQRRVVKEGPSTGRIVDKGASDYANVIGQAFAVRALVAAGSKHAPKARKFLLKQQCEDGYFRLNFEAKVTKRKQGCDFGDPATTSAPDVDATAIVILSLLEDPALADPKAVVAIADAVDWLIDQQRKNGSFGGGTSTEKPNANSTGLAGFALGTAGVCDRANKAAEWVDDLYVNGVSGEKGAIAYDKAALATAQDGISVEERDQFRRATAQAGPLLPFAVIDGCD